LENIGLLKQDAAQTDGRDVDLLPKWQRTGSKY